MRSTSILALAALMAAASFTAGCRQTTTFQYPDMGGTGGEDMAQGSTDNGDMAMSSNPCPGGNMVLTIAQMRQGTGSQPCVELDNVVVLSAKPGTRTHDFIVQDAAGGDYSGMIINCSSSSTKHMCAPIAFSTAGGLTLGHKVTITGSYIRAKASGFESFYLGTITDNGAGATLPAPATLQLADIQRNAKTMAKWHQIVTVALPEALKVYDLSPVEFQRNAGQTCQTAGCPCQFGFGMMPASSNATANACNGMTGPMTQTAQAMEVLVGTDFYKGFTFSSDCACAAKFSDTLVSGSNQVMGTISGILEYNDVYMATPPDDYQYIAPLTNAAFPIQ